MILWVKEGVITITNLAPVKASFTSSVTILSLATVVVPSLIRVISLSFFIPSRY